MFDLFTKEGLINMLFSLPVVLLALSIHEAAHAYSAHKLGDDTARNFGRITLNPLKYIDIIGFLCMLVAGVGWASPFRSTHVTSESRNGAWLSQPRQGLSLTF